MLSQAHLAELVADPRVKAAIRRWEDEENRMRAKVEGYFRDLQSTTRTAQNTPLSDDSFHGVAQRAVFRQ